MQSVNISTGKKHIVICCVVRKWALLIDTGLGVANIKEVVDKLTMLPNLCCNDSCSLGSYRRTSIFWKYWRPHFGERLDIREISDIAAAGEKESDLPGVSVSRRIWFGKVSVISRRCAEYVFWWGNFQSGRTNGASCSYPGTFTGTLLLLWSEKRVFVFGRLDLFRVFGYFLSYDRSEAILAICKKSAVFTFETYLAGTSQLFGFDRFGRQDWGGMQKIRQRKEVETGKRNLWFWRF